MRADSHQEASGLSSTIHAGRALIVSITDHALHGEDDGGAGALVTELLTEAGFTDVRVVATTQPNLVLSAR